jgi:hypothetical protein
MRSTRAAKTAVVRKKAKAARVENEKPGAAKIQRHRRRFAGYSLSIPARWTNHAADCVFTQFRASKPALNLCTCSIVPSGHSASTCQCSPSFRTTQNIGVRASACSAMLGGLDRYFWRIRRDAFHLRTRTNGWDHLQDWAASRSNLHLNPAGIGRDEAARRLESICSAPSIGMRGYRQVGGDWACAAYRSGRCPIGSGCASKDRRKA